MGKKLIFAIVACCLVLFGGLVYYGWSHRWGRPAPMEEPDFPVVDVHMVEPQDAEDLIQPRAARWEEIEPVEVELYHQVSHNLWPRRLIPEVLLRAVHDGSRVYVHMEWADQSRNEELTTEAFPDACSVAWSMKEDGPAQSIMMGFSEVVNIWHWRADVDAELRGEPIGMPAHSDRYQPFEEEEVFPVTMEDYPTPVQDLLSGRPGSLTRKEKQIVDGRGHWSGGRWRVVLTRQVRTDDPEADAQFDVPGRAAGALGVWEGESGDRGERKSVSDWVIFNFVDTPADEVARGTLDSTNSPAGILPASATADRGELSCAGANADNSDEAAVRSEGSGRQRGGPGVRREQSSGGVSFARAPRRGIAKREKMREPHRGLLQRLLTFSILPSAHAAQQAEAPEEQEHVTINMQAEQFHFTPSEITVQKGQTVTIVLESLDVTHGLYLDGYGVQTEARPGAKGQVTFVADRTGRFTFRCSETCGAFHPYMVGYLTVEPNSRFRIYVGAVLLAFIGISAFVMVRGSGRKGNPEDE